MTKQCSSCGGFCGKNCQRENINQEQGEPVAWRHKGEPWRFKTNYCIKLPDVIPDSWEPLYTTPQQRKPLMDEMVKQMKERCDSMEMRGAFADGWLSAEAAHGIKE